MGEEQGRAGGEDGPNRGFEDGRLLTVGEHEGDQVGVPAGMLESGRPETVPLDTVLAVRRSVYEFTVARADVVPTESEATDAIREAEARGLADVDGWWAL